MNDLNNFKNIKTHLNNHITTANLSWQENKQKASIKTLNYINSLVNQFKNKNNDTPEIIKTKLENIEKIKNTFLYVLDTLQKSLNQGITPNFPEFETISNNQGLDQQLYLNLIGHSTNNQNSSNTLIKSLSEKESKTILKNLKIIVTHKNTDGFWNNSNTKTNWFTSNKTKTHEDFVKFINNNFIASSSVFKNLSSGLNYIGGIGHHKAKPIEKLIGLDKDYKYINGFGVLKLGGDYNFAQIKGKFDKHGSPISGQIKCYDENNSTIKNNIEFYKNPKDNKYYFKRIIKQDNDNLKIYLFKTNDFYKNLKLITEDINQLKYIENKTPIFIGKKTENGYNGNLQLGEKCLIGDFDNNFQIIKLKEFGLKNNQSETQFIHVVNSAKQTGIVKDYTLNNLYYFSQSTLFSSKDFQYLFDKLKNIKHSINNQYIKEKVNDNCTSEYIGEVNNNGKSHGFGIINWSDSKHTFIGEFSNGLPIDGLIIKDNEVFHIQYSYNDENKIITDEKKINSYNLNVFMENIYKKYNNFITNNYENLKLNSLLNLITKKTGVKINEQFFYKNKKMINESLKYHKNQVLNDIKLSKNVNLDWIQTLNSDITKFANNDKINLYEELKSKYGEICKSSLGIPIDSFLLLMINNNTLAQKNDKFTFSACKNGKALEKLLTTKHNPTETANIYDCALLNQMIQLSLDSQLIYDFKTQMQTLLSFEAGGGWQDARNSFQNMIKNKNLNEMSSLPLCVINNIILPNKQPIIGGDNRHEFSLLLYNTNTEFKNFIDRICLKYNNAPNKEIGNLIKIISGSESQGLMGNLTSHIVAFISILNLYKNNFHQDPLNYFDFLTLDEIVLLDDDALVIAINQIISSTNCTVDFNNDIWNPYIEAFHDHNNSDGCKIQLISRKNYNNQDILKRIEEEIFYDPSQKKYYYCNNTIISELKFKENINNDQKNNLLDSIKKGEMITYDIMSRLFDNYTRSTKQKILFMKDLDKKGRENLKNLLTKLILNIDN